MYYKMSNFDKVIEFNKAFGLPHNDVPQKEVFTENKKLTKLRVDLIDEEFNELKDAIKTNDFTEVVDALADILYVVYGAASSFGVNVDKAFDIVHKSNMSKLCTSVEQAIRTVESYKKLYKDGHSPYDSPSYRLSENKKYWVVYNESTGKILKSIDYTPANFDTLLK